MTTTREAAAVLPRGVYLLTDATLCGDRGLDVCVRDALVGGARIVQYRDKGNDRTRRLAEARRLRALCREAGATFIVNDDPRLAVDCEADGVHVGRDDADPGTLRRRYGTDLLIGVSCYDSLELARAAAAAGADYVAFGSAYPSPTKPAAVRAPLALYRTAAAALDVPVVAIGGITADNLSPLAAAGCHAVAVVSAVLAGPDVRAAAAAMKAAFEAAA
jgi:thiamine-phosphate pyrophosphorylase